MMKYLKYSLFLLFLLPVYCAKAQESMMPDVSYPFLERLIDSAKLKYPRMKRFAHKVDAARYDAQKAKMGWFDAITLSYVYNPTTTNTGTVVNNQTVQSYEPGLFLNVGSILKNAPTVRAAKKNIEIAQDELEEYNLNIEEIVKERYFTYVQKLAVLNQRTKSKDDAETDLKEVKHKFEKGEETFDNYSKMLVIYTVSIQSKLDAEGAALISKASLEEIIAGKLEDIK